jgi:hypothetical protein
MGADLENNGPDTYMSISGIKLRSYRLSKAMKEDGNNSGIDTYIYLQPTVPFLHGRSHW